LQALAERVLSRPPQALPQVAFAGGHQQKHLDNLTVARQRLSVKRIMATYGRMMFSEKKDGEEGPKGFEKFFKKKEGSQEVKEDKKEEKKPA
jgi:hypothetical protein